MATDTTGSGSDLNIATLAKRVGGLAHCAMCQLLEDRVLGGYMVGPAGQVYEAKRNIPGSGSNGHPHMTALATMASFAAGDVPDRSKSFNWFYYRTNLPPGLKFTTEKVVNLPPREKEEFFSDQCKLHRARCNLHRLFFRQNVICTVPDVVSASGIFDNCHVQNFLGSIWLIFWLHGWISLIFFKFFWYKICRMKLLRSWNNVPRRFFIVLCIAGFAGQRSKANSCVGRPATFLTTIFGTTAVIR